MNPTRGYRVKTMHDTPCALVLKTCLELRGR
jgi:hypothetical protein